MSVAVREPSRGPHMDGPERSTPEKPSPAAPPRSIPALVLLGVVGVVVWLSLLRLPLAPGDQSVDSSWEQAIAFLVRTRAAAGTDWIFTYGPAGLLLTTFHDPASFWWRMVWEAVVKAALAVYLLQTGQALGRVERVLYAVSLGTLLLFPAPDAVYLILLSVVIIRMIVRAPLPPAPLLLSGAILGGLAAAKLTFLIFGLAVLPAAEVVHRRRKPTALVSPLTVFLAGFVLWWTLLGQPLSAVPAFVKSGLQVLAGYGEAMALPGSTFELLYAVLPLLCAALALLLAAVQIRSARYWLALVPLALGLLISWKHGFVRQDVGHVPGFFLYLLFLPFFILAAAPRVPARPLRVVAAATFILALGGLVRPGPVKAAVTGYPSRLREAATVMAWPPAAAAHAAAEQDKVRASMDFKSLAEGIGDASVDMIGQEQGYLLLEGLAWRPRPVFQSYVAYSPPLLQANAHFLQGADAPGYLLVKIQPLDGRFPTLEDSLTLREVLRRYRPVAGEKAFGLFRRNPQVSRVTIEGAPREIKTRLGEWVDLPAVDGFRFLQLHLEPSLPGKLLSAAVRPPLVFMEVETQSGARARYRVVPAMATQPFLVDPLVRSTADLVELYVRGGEERVSRLRIVRDAADSGPWLNDDVVLRLTEDRTLPAHRVSTDVARRVNFSMMETLPQSTPAGGEADVSYGAEAFAVLPGAELRFDVPAGARTLEGRLGALPVAWRDALADEMKFVVEWLPAEGPPKPLLERTLRPGTDIGDRGLHRFSVKLPGGSGKVVLRTAGPYSGQEPISCWTSIHLH